jgi:hypothetical protein
MTLKEELRQLGKNLMQDARLLYEKVKQYPLISLFFIIAVFLLIAIPHWQVSGINNATEKDTHENQARATLAQIFGGAAIGIGLYYTWWRITIAEEDLKATQKNLEIAQEGQITERFTRAVEQLGNPAMEIRLGGIYALERIANESDRDYWPIMEILTAYVREKSPEETIERIKITYSPLKFLVNDNEKNEKLEVTKMPLDIQAILTVIGRRKYSSNSSETKSLDLRNG